LAKSALTIGQKSLDWRRAGQAVFVGWLLLSSHAACPATITVEGDAPLESIALTVEHSTLNKVVLDLSQKYGFEVAGLEMLNGVGTLSANLTGSLRGIIEKLLGYCNYCNYMILSSDSKSGVERVIILKSTQGLSTRQLLQPNPGAPTDIPSDFSSPVGSMFGLEH
jgi:hypothetical protein